MSKAWVSRAIVSWSYAVSAGHGEYGRSFVCVAYVIDDSSLPKSPLEDESHVKLATHPKPSLRADGEPDSMMVVDARPYRVVRQGI